MKKRVNVTILGTNEKKVGILYPDGKVKLANGVVLTSGEYTINQVF